MTMKLDRVSRLEELDYVGCWCKVLTTVYLPASDIKGIKPNRLPNAQEAGIIPSLVGNLVSRISQALLLNYLRSTVFRMLSEVLTTFSLR